MDVKHILALYFNTIQRTNGYLMPFMSI
jgi:hypothetical protein